MNFLDKLSDWMNDKIAPVAEKLDSNNVLKALQYGMMGTMPIMIGCVLVIILTNLPIEAWTNFLYSTGLYMNGMELMMSTLSMMAIYMVISVSYNYTRIKGKNPLTGTLLTVAVYFILIPQFMQAGDTTVQAIQSTKLGSEGMFVAMFLGILVPWAYCWLSDKNITLKLPAGVPPMVTESLSPVFIGIIIFTTTFLVKWGLSLTQWGDLFTFVNQVVAAPVLGFGGTPIAVICVYTIINVFWFFGIHPAAISSAYGPILTTLSATLIENFAAGNAIDPNAVMALILAKIFIMGGTGGTLGMVVQSCFAKADQFRSVGRLSLIPSLFNINEPVIFGFPVMLNPVFFLPMVLVVPVTGLVTYGWMSMFGFGNFNPAVSMPWATPTVLTGFVQGGLMCALVYVIAILVQWLVYFPFFRVADKQAFKEEQASK